MSIESLRSCKESVQRNRVFPSSFFLYEPNRKLWWILELLERDERTKPRTKLTELRHTACAYYY